jgi:HlyD family secretion protein
MPRSLLTRAALSAPLVLGALLALNLLTACSGQRDGVFSGYVETEPVRVASPIGGRLVKLAVQRGDQVASGAPLFTLESDTEAAALHESQARLQQAEAQAADLGKGSRPDELAARRAALEQARAALVQSSSDLKRQRDLADAHFVSPATLVAFQARRDADASRVQQLEAELRVARLGGRDDTRTAAQAQSQAARAAVAQSQWALKQKSVAAPLAARVDDTLYREGEWVPAGAPVVNLIAPTSIKLRFYVPESQRATLAPGSAVQARCDACGGPISATVRYVATQAEYTPPVIYSQDERSKLVFMVEAWPQPADAAKLPPGMPVEVQLMAHNPASP